MMKELRNFQLILGNVYPPYRLDIVIRKKGVKKFLVKPIDMKTFSPLRLERSASVPTNASWHQGVFTLLPCSQGTGWRAPAMSSSSRGM